MNTFKTITILSALTIFPWITASFLPTEIDIKDIKLNDYKPQSVEKYKKLTPLKKTTFNQRNQLSQKALQKTHKESSKEAKEIRNNQPIPDTDFTQATELPMAEFSKEILSEEYTNGLPHFKVDKTQYTNFQPSHEQLIERSKVDDEREEYKKYVLMRLAAKIGGEKDIKTIPQIEDITQVETPETEQNAIVFDDTEQLSSETQLAPESNFNFSSFTNQLVEFESKSLDGEITPYTSFSLENESGGILLESFTDENGCFSKTVKCFSTDKLYIRYHSTGLSNEREAITIKGEEE